MKAKIRKINQKTVSPSYLDVEGKHDMLYCIYADLLMQASSLLTMSYKEVNEQLSMFTEDFYYLQPSQEEIISNLNSKRENVRIKLTELKEKWGDDICPKL